jgi:hypothetical protein
MVLTPSRGNQSPVPVVHTPMIYNVKAHNSYQAHLQRNSEPAKLLILRVTLSRVAIDESHEAHQ